jgi:hypothetical protein
MVYPKELMLD